MRGRAYLPVMVAAGLPLSVVKAGYSHNPWRIIGTRADGHEIEAWLERHEEWTMTDNIGRPYRTDMIDAPLCFASKRAAVAWLKEFEESS